MGRECSCGGYGGWWGVISFGNGFEYVRMYIIYNNLQLCGIWGYSYLIM
jgi:hypothetical protein